MYVLTIRSLPSGADVTYVTTADPPGGDPSWASFSAAHKRRMKRHVAAGGEGCCDVHCDLVVGVFSVARALQEVWKWG